MIFGLLRGFISISCKLRTYRTINNSSSVVTFEYIGKKVDYDII